MGSMGSMVLVGCDGIFPTVTAGVEHYTISSRATEQPQSNLKHVFDTERINPRAESRNIK
jgi:hypothetical protein